MDEKRCTIWYNINYLKIRENPTSFHREKIILYKDSWNNDFFCFYFSIGSLKAKEQYHQITEQNDFQSKILYLVKLSCKDEENDKFRLVVKTTEILNHNEKLNKQKNKLWNKCDEIQRGKERLQNYNKARDLHNYCTV